MNISSAWSIFLKIFSSFWKSFRTEDLFFFFSFISKNIQDFFDYLELLQNAATVITKRGSLLDDHFYYKTGQVLLQNAAGITKRGKGYYKTRQVLQNGARVITKRGRYYKTGQLLQNGASLSEMQEMQESSTKLMLSNKQSCPVGHGTLLR